MTDFKQIKQNFYPCYENCILNLSYSWNFLIFSFLVFWYIKLKTEIVLSWIWRHHQKSALYSLPLSIESAIAVSSDIIWLFPLNIILLQFRPFSEKKFFIVFQNFLLSLILIMSSFEKNSFLVFQRRSCLAKKSLSFL